MKEVHIRPSVATQRYLLNTDAVGSMFVIQGTRGLNLCDTGIRVKCRWRKLRCCIAFKVGAYKVQDLVFKENAVGFVYMLYDS